ncbi:hypothetical protein A3A41_03315 [Candidatus Kaiserbacteria bacterium RIFCSPLOWO2_01_FULL_54_22]|nr:MAG: hypothetical protein A3A41_03315 [Candidatus Kaiserbacteria bacterium RIFCSPLOWO2_01_FULL_54_22]
MSNDGNKKCPANRPGIFIFGPLLSAAFAGPDACAATRRGTSHEVRAVAAGVRSQSGAGDPGKELRGDLPTAEEAILRHRADPADVP